MGALEERVEGGVVAAEVPDEVGSLGAHSGGVMAKQLPDWVEDTRLGQDRVVLIAAPREVRQHREKIHQRPLGRFVPRCRHALKRLDPVRLHAAYRRHTATVAFRKEPLLAVTADNLHQHQKKGDATTTLGELGQRRRSSQQYHGALATGDGSDGSGSSVGGSRDVSGALSTPLGDTSTKAVSESLESALEEVPKNFRLSSVVKDAFSYVRKYQLVPYQLRCNSVN